MSLIRNLLFFPDIYTVSAKTEAVTRMVQIVQTTAIPLMVMPALMVYFFWGEVPTRWLMVWLAVAITIQIVSLLFTRAYFMRFEMFGSTDFSWVSRWARRISWVFGAQGTLWGGTTMLILVVDSTAHQILVLVVAMAYPFALLFGSSFWPALQYSLMLPMCGLTIVALILKGDSGSLGLAAIWVVVLLILHSMARLAYRSTMSGIQLQFDKDDLVERLRVQTDLAEHDLAPEKRIS